MKKLNLLNNCIALVVAASVVASCAKTIEPLVPAADEPAAGLTFTGSIAQFAPDTRTTLGFEDQVCWSSDDQISINGVIYNVLPDESDPTKGTFTKADATVKDPVAPYRAFYPPMTGIKSDLFLPAVQTYSADAIANSPMFAQSSTTELQFLNLCALLEFNLYTPEEGKETKAEDIVYKSLKKIEVFADQPVNGPANVMVRGMTNPVYYAGMTENLHQSNQKVTLDCLEGVELDEGITTFRVAIPMHIKEYADPGINLRI